MSEFSRRSFFKAGLGAAAVSALADTVDFAEALEVPSAAAPLVVCSAASMLTPDSPPETVSLVAAELRRAGVSCVFCSVATREDWPTTMQRVLKFSSSLHSQGFVVARSLSELDTAAREGKPSVVFHCRGSYLLGSPFLVSRPMVSTFDIKRIGLLHELGVRVMQVTDEYKGYLGDGCSERTDCSLTDYGLWAIKTMNEQGVVIDCSESGYRTSMMTMDISSKPVIFSHSNAKAIHSHPANISDEQIRAAAAKGGVIGLTAQTDLLKPIPSGTDALVAQIQHVVDVAGIDHVGIGFGYPSGSADKQVQPAELLTRFSTLWESLSAKGFADDSIRKIQGGNFLRVFRQVWKG
jgi:membrane dipeptidase